MQQRTIQQEEEISLRELVAKARDTFRYLIKKWFVIALAVLLGGAAGLAYALLQPVKYTSRLSFVIEESKAGGGGLASLAGQFGFDLGGSGGGVFSGDNILLFLKSESLCRETLLTNYDSSGKTTLADVYAESNELKSDWTKDKNIGSINFARYKNGNLPRLEDSLIQLLTRRILTKDLTVDKPDKKASFIEVGAKMRDELLSQYFADRLVKIATQHYVESKTKVKALNVAKLQHRADSLGALLNNRTYSAAASQQSLLDVNPGLRMAPVTAEITNRDKTMIATIFAEVVKNLEVAKVALSQETPTIQMVDESSLPLKKEKTSKLMSILAGAAIAALIFTMLLLLRRWWKKQMTQQEQSASEENGFAIPPAALSHKTTLS